MMTNVVYLVKSWSVSFEKESVCTVAAVGLLVDRFVRFLRSAAAVQ